MDNKNEMFPEVDIDGRFVGTLSRGAAHGGTMRLHPVVHLHVFNSHGDIYLQKRPQWKDIQPGRWDTATGGHVDLGETVAEALRREVHEELGITDFQPISMGHYVFNGKRERELVYVHKTVYDGLIKPNADELDDGRFWTLCEIEEAMGMNVLTPNFESEYKRFFL